MVQHFRFCGDLREVFRERAFRRRDRNLRDHLATLRLDRRREIVPVVVAESIIRKDHGHLLAEICRHPRRDGGDLRADIGNPGLKAPAVHLARSDVVALADHIIGNLEFAGGRRRADDDMREQCAVDDVRLVLVGKFGDHFCAALGIGAVILDNDLHRPSIDAAGLVDQLDRGICRALVPAAVGGADARLVCLEADLDRRRTLRLRVSHKAGRGDKAAGGGEALQRRAA